MSHGKIKTMVYLSDVYYDVLDLLKAAIWGNTQFTKIVSQEVYDELKKHTVLAIITPILKDLVMDQKLRIDWNKQILHLVAFSVQNSHEQATLPITVPYVVLKGTEAARYYPVPMFRTSGDIDILPRKECFEIACSMLQEAGYQEVTSKSEREFGRHRSFRKNDVLIEVHAFFALMREHDKAEELDNLLFENITDSHKLPDMINGLVLLEHMNQHMSGGLGLRHILDWMLFVSKCLPDENWPDFQKKAQLIGLEKLAITTTRMCEIYLDLPERIWCAEADEGLCSRLMEYVLMSGNFGIKRQGENVIGEGFFAYARSLKDTFRLLSLRGKVNWKIAKEHKWLSPLAWLYQLFRYLVRGLGREHAFKQLRREYVAAKRKNDLLDELRVRRDSDV